MLWGDLLEINTVTKMMVLDYRVILLSSLLGVHASGGSRLLYGMVLLTYYVQG